MPNPIHKVLSTLKACHVKHLLMGGQACVYYGAAEFSRDTDVALLANTSNLECLRRALDALEAELIAVPDLTLDYLDRGHAVHFRCHHPHAVNMRLDVMSVMRGLPSFQVLWERRTTALVDGAEIDMLSLPDLVTAKKTQRDKDWPMIRRLVESHFDYHEGEKSSDALNFWFRESRTPSMLLELYDGFPGAYEQCLPVRPLLRILPAGNVEAIELALHEEEVKERALDRAYWKPLREELERIRWGKRRE